MITHGRNDSTLRDHLLPFSVILRRRIKPEVPRGRKRVKLCTVPGVRWGGAQLKRAVAEASGRSALLSSYKYNPDGTPCAVEKTPSATSGYTHPLRLGTLHIKLPSRERYLASVHSARRFEPTPRQMYGVKPTYAD